MDKKDFRAQIEEKLETALAGFSKAANEKKFKKQIKKASKILAEGLVIPEEKPEIKTVEPAEVKPVKKAKSKKAAEPEVKKIAKKAAVKKAKQATVKKAKQAKPAKTEAAVRVTQAEEKTGE